VTEINWADLHRDATTILEGDFPVVVSESVATKSSNDKPMIKVKLRVESGPKAGQTLFSQFVLSAENPNAMRIFFGQMSIFGLDSAFFARNASASLEVIAQALVGRRAIAVVEAREWNGTQRENIKEYKKALGGPGVGAGTTLGGLVTPGPSNPSAPATPPAVQAELGRQPSTPPPDDPFTLPVN
jgi:hypothetical protein